MRSIDKLREEMKARGISYFLITSADAHQSEYVAEHYTGRAFISGFTGSSGILLVGLSNAKLWTDGRYFIQANEQLSGTGIDLMKMATEGYPTLSEWINDNIKDGETLAFDGRCVSANSYKEILELSEKNKFNIDINTDLLQSIWSDRPRLPKNQIFIHEETYSGKSAVDKINQVKEIMSKEGIDNYLLTSLDDIAWLLNLRGNDITYNPVFLSNVIITKGKTTLFIDEAKVTEDVKEQLNNSCVEIEDYQMAEDYAKKLDGVTLIDPTKVNGKLYSLLNGEIKEGINITTKLKAIKNNIEIENLKHCHIKDGVAMVKLIKYLKDNLSKETLTEISIAEKLSDIRLEGDLAIGDSFNTIAAYKEHAAMMHYSATEESNYTLKQEGLFLLDSGGQYLDGTTDITRTFALGNISKEERKAFTLVLKGMINLTSAKFLKGTTGCNLDILARGPLWKEGIDYKCGTGHGVGFFLNVHEGPQGIRQKGNDVPLEPGMILTNEPGVYKSGEFGIRLENIMVVAKDRVTDSGEFYRFETITFCPIDLDAIDIDLLNNDEKEWLNNYHKEVFDKLSGYLNQEEKEFLKFETRQI